tara:strand:- start:16 stop:207 length:192 start_codon:yes stop_codon:yes gene_type:complete
MCVRLGGIETFSADCFNFLNQFTVPQQSYRSGDRGARSRLIDVDGTIPEAISGEVLAGKSRIK